MSKEFQAKYEDLKKEFLAVKKRICKEKLSRNPGKLEEYKRDIISAHDDIVTLVSEFINDLHEKDKEYLRAELVYFRDKTIECFGRLNLNLVVSTDLLAKINEEKFSKTDEGNSNINDPNTSAYSDANETTLKSVHSEEESSHSRRSSQSSQSRRSSLSSHSNHEDMALTKIEFLRNAAHQINYTYSGDPLALEAFINAVELLKELVTDELQPTFRKFVRSKLVGKALESIPEQIDSVDDITNALRQHIKPDNSKVIAGRMLALRVDRSKMSDFTEQAEKLSEALQRSLIIEGISQAKAREMTIEKAVDVCRNAARSDLVKSVLSATPFASPKEVFAKFVVESATEYKEKQILAFKQQQKRGNPRGRGFKNGRNFQNNRNGYNGNSNNYNGNSNYRGRGQGRGRGNGRGRGGYNNYNNNGYQEHYVRYAENAGGPPQSWRADQQNQPQQDQRQFQIPYHRN